MIKEIRQYIKESIACVDPQMKMDKQPLTISTIPTTAIESTYTVRFGLTTLSRDDSDINGLFRVSVDIFKKLGTSPNDTYDNAYLKALLIYSTISDQERINQDDYIKAISDVELTSDNVESDDNTVVFSMQFNVVCYFSLKNNNN